MAIEINYTSYSFRTSNNFSANKPCGPCQKDQQAELKEPLKHEITPSVVVSLSDASISTSSLYQSELSGALHKVDPSAEVSVKPREPNNPYSSTILSAINGQLALDVTDGADTAQLQTRLTSGLDGFLQGFNEAFEQLSAMAGFSSDIQRDVLGTKEQVLNGLLDTAKQLGLDDSAIEDELTKLAIQKAELGTTQEPEQAQNIQSLSRFDSAMSAQQNTFKFQLLTKDGDKIDILVSALKATAQTNSENGSAVQRADKNQFSLSVEGELDSDELKAINDLLKQVSNISEAFYQGNVEQAFDQALSMGYDSTEISSFALQLTQSSVTHVKGYSASPKGYSEQHESSKPQLSKNLVHLGAFIKALEKGHLLAEEMGQPKQLVTQLADQLSNKGNDQQGISSFIERFSINA